MINAEHSSMNTGHINERNRQKFLPSWRLQVENKKLVLITIYGCCN